MNIAIVGAGGFGREVYHHILGDTANKRLRDVLSIRFYIDDAYVKDSKIAHPLSTLPLDSHVIVAIGDPKKRRAMVDKLPIDTKFFTYVHSSAILLDESLGGITIGEGSIICAGTILTTNIKIGKHAHLNLHSSVGHDCVIGDYFTTAPGARISGNCNIGNRVYFGTNASCKEKMDIVDDVVVGLNAGVTKSLSSPGTYVGTPARSRELAAKIASATENLLPKDMYRLDDGSLVYDPTK